MRDPASTDARSAVARAAGAGASLEDRIVERSIETIEAFRGCFGRFGYVEEHRVPLVSRHDPSIRFTNSTISVLKPRLATRVDDRVFLVQPALRLRNLNHWREHGVMSPYGCSFIALGTLGPPETLRATFVEVAGLFVDDLQVDPDRLLVRVSSADRDIVDAVAPVGLPIEHDGYAPSRFRHAFGVDGLIGRNANIAVRSGTEHVDVANVIVIERDGVAIGVEAAFGVNMILAQVLSLDHPVLASTGAVAGDDGIDELIVLDALGTAAALALEGVRPRARGREGNYRSVLSVLAAGPEAQDGRLERAIQRVVEAEWLVRQHVSPRSPQDPDDLDAGAAAGAMAASIDQLRSAPVDP